MSNMFPCFPLSCLPCSRTGYVESSSNLTVTYSERPKLEYFSNLFVCKFCLWTFRPPGIINNYFWVPCVPMLISSRLTTTLRSIIHIVLIGACLKVLTTAARRPIAFVKNIQWRWICAVLDKIRYACSPKAGFFLVGRGRKFPVAVLVHEASPFPALSLRTLSRSFVNVLPKTLNILRGKRRQWFNIVTRQGVPSFGSLIGRVALTRFTACPLIIARSVAS